MEFQNVKIVSAVNRIISTADTAKPIQNTQLQHNRLAIPEPKSKKTKKPQNANPNQFALPLNRSLAPLFRQRPKYVR